MRVMVTMTGVVCDKEVRARVMPKAMRSAGDEEGEGSKATATATRVVGVRWQWPQGGEQEQGREQGWQGRW
jgi:hypothetical protein